jgi:arylsulfatase A-like enzyme
MQDAAFADQTEAADGRVEIREGVVLDDASLYNHDLAPTTLDLVGVAAPSTFEGRSVSPAVTAREPERAVAYLEAMDASLTRNWAPLTGLVSGGYKVIDLPTPELYDLAADPKETTNLFARESERARTLESLLRDPPVMSQLEGRVQEMHNQED